MTSDDETKKLLEQLMSELHAQQASAPAVRGVSYIQGGDDTFLGNIDGNRYDKNSLSNKYGPYGSRYSQTSIFNQYSPYGSIYGIYSLKNPNAFKPPSLFISGRFAGQVTSNPRIPNAIPADEFLIALQEDIRSVADGSFLRNRTAFRRQRGGSFLEASDKTYLGSLNPNKFDNESIFNEFGPYGSQFSPTSIFNQFGTYGNPYSQLSPFNQFSKNGPRVYLNGSLVGQLTKNTFVSNRIDPDDIKDWATRNVTPSY